MSMDVQASMPGAGAATLLRGTAVLLLGGGPAEVPIAVALTTVPAWNR